MSIEPEIDPPETTTDGEAASEGSNPPAEPEEPSAEEKLAAMKEQLLRTAADFDNFRKRSRREQEDALQSGRETMLKDLLPVFDNLERAVAHSDAATDVASFVSGIEMVMRQFQDSLGRSGIERVAGVGSAFDPSVHEAIQQIETDEYEPGTVAAEVQGGYKMGERLIRPAMVVVAKSAAGVDRETHVEPTSAAGDGDEAPN